MNVDTAHRDYGIYSPKWKKCRDVAGGEVKAGKDTYLPLLSGHDNKTDSQYLAYLTRAHYYNATGRTIDALSGAVFSQAPDIEWPERAEALTEDITLTGCTLEELANQAIEELLAVGRFGVMVDHTGNGAEITVAQAEALNRRPKLVPYKTEQIINWRYERINNRYQLSLVVLKETYEEPMADIFQMEEKTRYRVLRMLDGSYIQEVYENLSTTTTADFQPTERFTPTIGGKRFDYLPFFMFGPCNAQEIEQPPLLDLIEANLSHYRTSADYEHASHRLGTPTLFGVKLPVKQGEAFPVGGFYNSSDAESDLKYVEFEGKGLETLEKSLDRKEQHMASLGARLLQDSPRSVETAEAVNTKQSGENSVLASLAKSAGKGLTWCLKIMAEWERLGDEVGIELNQDYIPDTVDSNTISALLKAVQAGKLSNESFVYNMQRGGYLPEGKTLDDEIAESEEEFVPPPAPAGVNSPPQAVGAN